MIGTCSDAIVRLRLRPNSTPKGCSWKDDCLSPYIQLQEFYPFDVRHLTVHSCGLICYDLIEDYEKRKSRG